MISQRWAMQRKCMTRMLQNLIDAFTDGEIDKRNGSRK